jgi:hypothetical protein
MKPSFAPLDPEAVAMLTALTGIDYGHTDFTAPRWFCVTARRWNGDLQGVLACEFKTWFDVHFSCAIADPRCLSKKLLNVIFKSLFSRAVRITALVDPGNERAIDQMRRMGFVYEGFLRMGVEGTRDALLFGMLRDDCRFLAGYHPARTTIHPMPLGGFHGLVS